MSNKKTKAKQNQRRTSVLTTLLLLLLTLILLITSTYAWFTANQIVSINQIDVNVAATNGLEISADAEDWKTSITKSDINEAITMNGNQNQLPATIVPCSTAGDIGTAGHLNMYKGIVNANLNTSGYYITSELVEEENTGTDSEKPFIAFDFYLKYEGQTGVDRAVYLDYPGCYVEHLVRDPLTGTLTIDRDGSVGLENAARVAFVLQGSVGVNATGTAARNISGTTNQSNTYLWEPNNDTHTQAAIANAPEFFGIDDLSATDAPITYDGMYDAIPATNHDVDLTTCNRTEFPEYFKQLTFEHKLSTYKQYLYHGDNGSEKSVKIFDLQPGIYKLRCYMWVEGQDVDCEDHASGTDIMYNVQFTIKQQS